MYAWSSRIPSEYFVNHKRRPHNPPKPPPCTKNRRRGGGLICHSGIGDWNVIMSIGTYPCRRGGACISYNMYTLPPSQPYERRKSKQRKAQQHAGMLFSLLLSLFVYTHTAKFWHGARPSMRASYQHRPFPTDPRHPLRAFIHVQATPNQTRSIPSRPFLPFHQTPQTIIYIKDGSPHAPANPIHVPTQPTETQHHRSNPSTNPRFTSCSAPAAPACAPAWWAAPRAAAPAWAPPSWPWPARGRAP